MFGKLHEVKIQGIYTVVPENVVDNMEFADKFGLNYVKKQIRMTGIKKRHVCLNQEATDELCYQAAEKLLDKLQWNRDSIHVLIYVTETPNFQVPSTAFYLQKKLGLGSDCLVFDINLGCPGWVFGIQIISSLMQSFREEGKVMRGLLLTGSIISSMDLTEVDTAMLFGDAGTATALEYAQGHEITSMFMSDGTKYDKVFKEKQTPGLHMDGAGIFDFSINQVTADIKRFLPADNNAIDYYIFHQAQKFIIDNIQMILDIPEDNILRSYEQYGNTSSASIPLTLCNHASSLQSKQQINILCYAFGTGLSWGGLYMVLDTSVLYDIEYKKI